MSWCRSRSTRPIPTGCRAELELKPGDVVAVPLGAREAIGVVWADDVTIKPGLHNRLKDVERKLDVSAAQARAAQVRRLGVRLHAEPARHGAAHGLRMGEHLGPAREKVGVRLAGPPPKRMTAARGRVLQLLADGMVRTKSEAAQEAGVSAGVIDGLIDEGTLETLVLPPEPVARQPDPDHAVPEFTDAQRAAADALRATVAKGGFSVTLIDGVTGSGKTEVYFEAVAETIRRGRQVADPDAGDRAHRAIPRPLRASASACGRRNGIRSSRRASARAPGRRSRRARSRWWSARARRCSCLTPISA